MSDRDPPPADVSTGVLPPGAAADIARALFEQSPFSTVVYDTAGRIVAVNAAFERLFGLTRQALPPDYSVLEDAQLAAAGHQPAIRRAFEAGDVVVLPPVFYDAGALVGAGRSSWSQGHFFPMRGVSGAITGVMLVHVELTERIAAEHDAEAARQRLEEQTTELESHMEQLQIQATEMEAQQAELEQQRDELQAINEELQQTNEELATARAAAERAEAYLRGLLGSIADPFVVQDAEWRFRFVNAAAGALFARSGFDGPDGLLGKVVWDVFPELVGTAFDREMRRARDTCTTVAFIEFHAKSGAWSEMQCYPMPGGGLATLWRDVTARQQADESRHYLAAASEILARSLDREATVQELARLLVPRLADWCSVQLVEEPGTLRQVAVAHVDPAKVAWAHELHERYPPDPEQPQGAHWVARTGQAVLFTDIPEDLLVAAAQDAEHLRILREIGFASALTVPLAARGHVLGVMTLVTTTESGRRYGDAELALAQELASRAALAVDNAALYGAAVRARAEAEAANRAKAEFLATMSHELRTPLNAIGGYAQLIEMGVHGPVTEPQLEALRRVQRSQQHLLSLINDVLNFAKLEAGRVSYDIATVPVRDVIGGLESLVAPQLAAKALRYECDAGPPGLAVRADAEKAQQVLLNLLSNAIKFTPAGGLVRVSVEAAGGAVRVAVSDSGMGIPADKLEAVFEPFVQLARRGTPGQEGTGLGLAISRDLTRAMGGDLVASGAAGEGSTFTMTLPQG